MQRRQDELPEKIQPERRGDDQAAVERQVKRHHETLRRIEVAQLDAGAPGSACGSSFSVTTCSPPTLRHADLEHDVRRITGRQAGKLVAGDLVGAEPEGAELEGHRRPRLVEEMHPPDGIFEDGRELVVQKQAGDQRHEDHRRRI